MAFFRNGKQNSGKYAYKRQKALQISNGSH